MHITCLTIGVDSVCTVVELALDQNQYVMLRCLENNEEILGLLLQDLFEMNGVENQLLVRTRQDDVVHIDQNEDRDVMIVEIEQ